MVWTILRYVIIGMVLLLVGAWLWSGGYRSIVNFVRTIPNPVDIIWGTSTSTYQVQLPWQIPVPQGPDIEALADEGAAFYESSVEDQLAELEEQYGSLQEEATKLTNSPYYGSVSLSRAAAAETDPNSEFVVIRSQSSVKISGWTLMSSLTGRRAVIPLAAETYQLGALNSVQNIVLEGGTSAIVTTGFSPAGISFRENRCTGYLAQNQSFQPELSNACPSPSQAMPVTEENLQRYGANCVDYVRTIPQCTFVTSVPNYLSPLCRAFVVNTFSYNGCVQTYRYSTEFKLDTWRLYLSSPAELWGNTHDVIRLLDEYGRIVDSVTY